MGVVPFVILAVEPFEIAASMIFPFSIFPDEKVPLICEFVGVVPFIIVASGPIIPLTIDPFTMERESKLPLISDPLEVLPSVIFVELAVAFTTEPLTKVPELRVPSI